MPENITKKDEKKEPEKSKLVSPILDKYFNSKFLMDIIYENGGIAPGGYGVSSGGGFGGGIVEQDSWVHLVLFYGGLMMLAAKDKEECEAMVEEIGKNLVEHYKLTDTQKQWVEEKLIKKYNDNN